MEEPAFLWRQVTDDELRAELEAVREGRFPQWTFSGEARYAKTQGQDGGLVVRNYIRIWLADRAGVQRIITLLRARDAACWQRLDVLEEDGSG